MIDPKRAPGGNLPRSKECVELTADAAFQLLRQRTQGLSREVFDLYLDYDIIPSRGAGVERLLRQDDLEAFAARHPSGMRRSVATRSESLLSLREAFAAYVKIDPDPISLSEFRELAQAGVLEIVYTSQDPRAPVAGVRQDAVVAFLAARHRRAQRRAQERLAAEEHERVMALSQKMTEMLNARLKEKSDARSSS